VKNGPYELVVAPIDYPGFKYRGKYCYEHHLVWWRHTGELVLHPFLLHHKNEDKRDNRFENLEKLTRSEHTAQHGVERNMLTNMTRIPKHGTSAEYSRGCRCDLCRAKNAADCRDYRTRTGRTSSWYAKRKSIPE